MEKMAVNVRRYLIISSILALAASAAGCGGSSGDRSAGTGGTTGTPDTSASGGALASGGVLGNGGTPGNGGTTGTSTAPSCAAAFTPTPELITDFSSSPAGWHAAYGGGKWGTVGVFTGSIFGFAGPNSTMTATVETKGDMLLAGNVAVGDYAGGGLSFDQCVNTTTYTGVQFTLGGLVAGCDLYFYVQTFDEKGPGSGQIGGCTSNCYVFPGMKLASASGVVTVPFSALSGGQLITAPAISNEMVGLQWQLDSPAPQGDGGQPDCTGVALTVTNVSFVP
jgi:hypothetical protein